jgi:hypothetical protein
MADGASDPLNGRADDGIASAAVQVPHVKKWFVAYSLTVNVEKCRFFNGSLVFIMLAAMSGNGHGAVSFIFKGVVDDLIVCR